MAGITPAVTSPFGNRPSALPQDAPNSAELNGAIPNVPAEPVQSGAAQMVAEVAPPTAPSAAEPTSVDDLFAQLDAEAAPVAENIASEDLSTEPEPTGFASAKEQIKESFARLKNSFAVTGPESVAALKSFPNLFDDVKYENDKVLVKRKGRKGWEPFDRDKVELLGDALDFARDAMETVVEGGVEAMGTAAGAIVTGGPGGLLANAPAGAVGASAALSAGDAMAQHILGIPKDPNRNWMTEQALAGTLGAGFGWMGSSIARRAAQSRAVKTEARKTVDYAVKQAQTAMDDVAEIASSGIKMGPDGKVFLDPQLLVGTGAVPELDAIAVDLSTESAFRNYRRELGDSLVNAYDSVAKTLGAQAGRGASIADDFVLTAKDVRAAEGQLLGHFREQTEKVLKGVPQPLPKFNQAISDMVQQFGGITADDMALQLGVSASQAKQLRSLVNGYAGRLQAKGGALSFTESESIRKQLIKTIDANMGSDRGRPLAKQLIGLKNAILDDGLLVMEQALPGQSQAFQAAKGKYASIMENTAQLGKLLETENMSKNELIGKLFEGKGSYKFAQSAKTLINETNPELWDTLAGEYFQKLRNDATKGNLVNWQAMSKKWKNLDPRLQKELLTGVGIPHEGMNALLRLGERVQAASFPFKTKDPQLTAIKKTIKAVMNLRGGSAAQGTAVTTMLEGMGKDQAVVKWLKDGGMQELLKEMPGLKANKRDFLINWVDNWAPKGTKEVLDTQARQYLLRDPK